MTTTTLPDTGLGWLTFEDEDPTEVCEFRSDACTRQATHVGVFRTAAWCSHDRTRYCLAHRDMVLRQVLCAGGFFCGDCGPGTTAVFLRMEAL